MGIIALLIVGIPPLLKKYNKTEMVKKHEIVYDDADVNELITILESQDKTNYCDHCGNQLLDSDNFCISCGKKIRREIKNGESRN